MKYYAINNKKDVPSKSEKWTTDYIYILYRIILEENLFLFEKESMESEAVHIYAQFRKQEVWESNNFQQILSHYKGLENRLIIKDELNLFSNSIIGHEKDHAQRVAFLTVPFSAMKTLPVSDILVLLIGAMIHDIGRTWENLSDTHHGEKSFNIFARALSSSVNDIEGFTNKLNNYIGNLSLNIEDCLMLRHIVSIHSLEPSEKAIYREIHNLSNNQRFFELFTILDDCDALDRLRFRYNLNINYLNDPLAKRLIHYANKLNEEPNYRKDI